MAERITTHEAIAVRRDAFDRGVLAGLEEAAKVCDDLAAIATDHAKRLANKKYYSEAQVPIMRSDAAKDLAAAIRARKSALANQINKKE